MFAEKRVLQFTKHYQPQCLYKYIYVLDYFKPERFSVAEYMSFWPEKITIQLPKIILNPSPTNSIKNEYLAYTIPLLARWGSLGQATNLHLPETVRPERVSILSSNI